MGELSNAPLDINSTSGGAVRVTIASNIGRGNGGTSLPCRETWIAAAIDNTTAIRVNIGSAASAIKGVEIPQGIATLSVIGGAIAISAVSATTIMSAANQAVGSDYAVSVAEFTYTPPDYTVAANTPTPLRIPVDDVNELYFYGATNGDVVDIMYRT